MDFKNLVRAKPLVAAHLKSDFGAFCRACWPHLHAGSKLSWTPAHDLICEFLVAVHQGQMKRLIINCPPRFAKSSIVTILWPIWLWLQNPTLSFLCCSYEIDLATNHNLDRRKLMDSKWFKDLFGNFFQLASERSQAGEFQNMQGGTMQAASVNSKAQGRGGDYVIVDDPLSADAAFSESFRNETNSWFSHQLPQRLNNPNESRIVIVAQRLHQNDPCGFLLGQEESEWQLLKLPLIAEEDEVWRFPSGRVWKRKKGECLDPKRWSPRVVKERQRNRLVFSGQFQQSPVSAEGNLIHTDEILYFGGKDPVSGLSDGALPEKFDRRIISVDCSFKATAGSDFVAIIVVGIVGARRYLLHVTNARLDLSGTENEIRNAHATFGPVSATLVESTANGASVVQRLRDQIPGVVAIDPEGGKMARMQACAPEFQARNWFIERNGPWTHKVVEQLTMFPVGKNDDISDAISQASIWLQKNTYELGFVAYLKALADGTRPSSNREMFRSGPGLEYLMPPSCRNCGGSSFDPCTTGTPPLYRCSRCSNWTPSIAASAKVVTAAKTLCCPSCQSESLTRSAGAPANGFHCNGCSVNFLPDGTITSPALASEICASSHTGTHVWKPVPGQQLRCDCCGAQKWQGSPPPANGMTRARFEMERRDVFRGFGRFG
jgi:predicted phage terminase large subunit-like protein